MCVTEIVRSWLGLDLVLGSVHIATDLSSEDRARERRGTETGRRKKTWQPHNWCSKRLTGPLSAEFLVTSPPSESSFSSALSHAPMSTVTPICVKGSSLWTLALTTVLTLGWPLFCPHRSSTHTAEWQGLPWRDGHPGWEPRGGHLGHTEKLGRGVGETRGREETTTRARV